MRRVIAASMRFRFIVLAFAVGMVLYAAGQFRQMPVDVFPEFAPPRVEVQTAALGLAAEDVESFATTPLGQWRAGGGGPPFLRPDPARAVAGGRRGPRHPALEVRSAALVDRDDLQARHGPPPG